MRRVVKLPAKSSSRKKEELQVRALANTVGDFIRYWGFRRIHGQIWTEIFLSTTPLSGVELTRRLDVSKALVSPGLAQLEAFGLIEKVKGDAKTKRYSACADVFLVIQKILKEREKKLIQSADSEFRKLTAITGEGTTTIDLGRMQLIGEMIGTALMAIEIISELPTKEGKIQWPPAF